MRIGTKTLKSKQGQRPSDELAVRLDESCLKKRANRTKLLDYSSTTSLRISILSVNEEDRGMSFAWDVHEGPYARL